MTGTDDSTAATEPLAAPPRTSTTHPFLDDATTRGRVVLATPDLRDLGA
ncbi:MAG: hypothetical protein R3B06_12620 [Kofleriaceae bacterium]